MNRLSTAERTKIVACLVEGMSLRATARVTGFARMTIEKLLRDLGAACAEYQDKTFRGLNCQRVQCDEIWAFCYAKQKHVTDDMRDEHPDAGDVWTWTAIDADSRLCLSWIVGSRDLPTAKAFMQDVAGRLANRVQLTTDAYRLYLTAVDNAFMGEVDYAQLHKIYANEARNRYSPPACIGCKQIEVTGSPDPAHVSTSYVERQNLTMRMHLRRFTRLTNAFSKKVEMHAHSIALHFMHYNFAEIHQTLRVTPAMESGISDHVWSLEELVGLLDG